MMLHLLCLSLLLLDSEGAAALPALKTFHLPEGSDNFLSTPYDMDFDATGKLFVVDQGNHNVMYWDASGKCLGTFGRKGEGPGELENPFRIKVSGDEVFVLTFSNRMSVFDTSGKFKRNITIPVRIRAFDVLNPDLLLVYHRIDSDPTNFRVRFSLYNGKGELLKELLTLKDAMLISAGEGDNNAHINAYAGEGDIQYDGKGTWYYGYGSEQKLYRIDKDGKMLEPLKFSMVNVPPDDEDKLVMDQMSFPGEGGARLALKDLPGIKVHYDQRKGFFTQFVVMGDKVVFVLSPIGGTNGVGIGFWNCTYQICNLSDGKEIKSSRFIFPEDSATLFNHGRAIGFLANEDDSYEPVELTFK